MVSLLSLIVVGFLFGMRHATDPDHVVAVTTIVSRERSLRSAAVIGSLWGAGHTLTLLLVGGTLLLFGVVIPPRLGLGFELCVAVMLVLLDLLNLRAPLAHSPPPGPDQPPRHDHESPLVRKLDTLLGGLRGYALLRPLVVGLIHGLAGSAAVAILVMGTLQSPLWGLCYLLIFGAGTLAGMLLITLAMALPLRLSARRFARFHRGLGLAAGAFSVAFGLALAYRIGFVDGLFSAHPTWTPG
ncbi:MAG: high-affinity nickel-transport family protein [Minicystis sp.]